MPSGGYRKPSNPAPVSGPGALSRRTDGGPRHMQMPDAGYGEQASFQEAQSGAPMGAPAVAPGGMSAGGPSLVPLDAPTARPDEPVTAGAALGPGVGPEAIGLGGDATEAADLEQLRSYLPAFIEMANRDNSTQEFRNWVRFLRSRLR